MRPPLNWRRHWKLAATTAGIVAALVLVLGGIRVAAFTSGDGGPPPISDTDTVGTRLKGNSTLFGLAGSDEGGGGPQAPALGGSGTASPDSPEDLPWLIHFD